MCPDNGLACLKNIQSHKAVFYTQFHILFQQQNTLWLIPWLNHYILKCYADFSGILKMLEMQKYKLFKNASFITFSWS